MRVLVVTLVFCAAVPAAAQRMVDPSRIPAEYRSFESRPGETKLDCDVRPIRPWLNFSFHLQSGYTLELPIRQFFGPSHRVTMITRVSPRDADRTPAWFVGVVRFPDIPKTNVRLEFAGGYLLGEGEYKVDWLMYDDAGRVCRKAWNLNARLSRGEKHVQLAMAPHAIRAITFQRWSGDKSGERVPRVRRLTVLLHASPLYTRMIKLRGYDRFLLLGSLASLLERLPARSVRVVVFNLDQQRELFRRDDFRAEDFSEVSRALDSLELGLIDYSVLRNPLGRADLLAELMNQEVKESTDAVVFLGPPSRYFDKFPETAVDAGGEAASRFFYFRYRPYWQRGADFPDILTSAVKRIRGKTVVIRTPADFAKAIEQVEDANRTAARF